MDNSEDWRKQAAQYIRMYWKPLTSHTPYVQKLKSDYEAAGHAVPFPPLPALEEVINKILKDLGHGRSEE